MKAIKEEFPNPVLAIGRDDYIESCEFRTYFADKDISVNHENIVIPVNYSLTCNGIQKLVDAGDAVVAVRITCNAASYGKLFQFLKGTNVKNIEIPKYAVVGSIELQGVIIATHDITQFRCDGEFNDLYFGTTTFEIRKGDILAIEDSRAIEVDANELEKPIASIFNIKNNNNLDPNEKVYDIIPNFYEEKIEILLTPELYKLYYSFDNGTLRRYSNGIIVYPVLVEAISLIIGHYQNDNDNNDATDYSNKRWFRTIVHKAELKGIDFHDYEGDAISIANELLGNIAFDALKNVKDTLEQEENSGETFILGSD